MSNDIKAEITRVAREHLGFEMLETRGRDALSLHDVSVEGVRWALGIYTNNSTAFSQKGS